MQRLTLLLALTLSGCADFQRGFMESYNRAHANDYAAAYCAPEAQPTPDYTIHTALVTQMGQPPRIISYNQNSALITQMGQAPIIITGQ